MSDEVKLSAREQAVLFAMCSYLPEENGAPFKSINSYVRSWYGERDGCEPWNIRRTVRALARKGMTYLARGLMTDEGQLVGSGYVVSDAGRAWFEKQEQAS